jgi:hypothetical protein
VADLEQHLNGMESAMNSGASAIHEFANQLVSRRINPAVAAPINQAADEMASLAHQFTAAMTAFKTIYADRIAYQQNEQYKPDEKIWTDVGTA